MSKLKNKQPSKSLIGSHGMQYIVPQMSWTIIIWYIIMGLLRALYFLILNT